MMPTLPGLNFKWKIAFASPWRLQLFHEGCPPSRLREVVTRLNRIPVMEQIDVEGLVHQGPWRPSPAFWRRDTGSRTSSDHTVTLFWDFTLGDHGESSMTADACSERESIRYVWDAVTIEAVPESSPGVTHAVRSPSRDPQTGLWSYYVETTTAKYYKLREHRTAQDVFQEVLQKEHRNLRMESDGTFVDENGDVVEVQPAGLDGVNLVEHGHRKNPDCTTDVAVNIKIPEAVRRYLSRSNGNIRATSVRFYNHTQEEADAVVAEFPEAQRSNFNFQINPHGLFDGGLNVEIDSGSDLPEFIQALEEGRRVVVAYYYDVPGLPSLEEPPVGYSVAVQGFSRDPSTGFYSYAIVVEQTRRQDTAEFIAQINAGGVTTQRRYDGVDSSDPEPYEIETGVTVSRDVQKARDGSRTIVDRHSRDLELDTGEYASVTGGRVSRISRALENTPGIPTVSLTDRQRLTLSANKTQTGLLRVAYDKESIKDGILELDATEDLYNLATMMKAGGYVLPEGLTSVKIEAAFSGGSGSDDLGTVLRVNYTDDGFGGAVKRMDVVLSKPVLWTWSHEIRDSRSGLTGTREVTVFANLVEPPEIPAETEEIIVRPEIQRTNDDRYTGRIVVEPRFRSWVANETGLIFQQTYRKVWWQPYYLDASVFDKPSDAGWYVNLRVMNRELRHYVDPFKNSGGWTWFNDSIWPGSEHQVSADGTLARFDRVNSIEDHLIKIAGVGGGYNSATLIAEVQGVLNG